ncbi:DUF7144 family membrane protein [Streptomyces armeniacus]|uniref:DUF7144 family membrane protein n=1 Tax=Streptomyces armeniacus TaxID=83291 RepID=UPI001FEA66EC|nr:hypothetical protein [Streptomyces armeniacus]
MAHTVRHQPVHQGFAGGIVVFGAVMLLIAGVLDVFRGIVAIAKDDLIVATPDYTFEFDTAGWGWVHLILGAATVLVAFGLFSGSLWARVVGVVMAGLLIVSSFLSLPYYPVWSIVLMAMSALVIWALCTMPSGAGAGAGAGEAGGDRTAP